MAWPGVIAATLIIVVVLVDAFEAMILPRRIRHSYRLARLFYRTTWHLWRRLSHRFKTGRQRHMFLSIFGPLSLFALMFLWGSGLVLGFALLHWSLDSQISIPSGTSLGFDTYLYFSGTTFFTLGYGDVVPARDLGRVVSIIEAGVGFGFLAVVISYLPVLYQAFSRREIVISLLDARAGSPPSAGEFLRRLGDARSLAALGPMLVEWERWCAEVLESHLSFPVLRFYRSQHDNQSWVGALTTILDTSAFLIVSVDSSDRYQAQLTFAMARHAAVDMVLVSQTGMRRPADDRLPPEDLARLREWLHLAGVPMRDETTAAKALTEMRSLYEPFVQALATELEFELPKFVPMYRPVDNWQTSPGMGPSPGLTDLQVRQARDEHLD